MEKPQSEEVVLFGTWASAHCTRVPVLVHTGKPIAESLVILEYIDDCWNISPNLLPLDPYPKPKFGFGPIFLTRSSYAIILSKGKEQENAIKEFNQLLSAFEEGIEKDFSTKFPSNGGNETLGFLEIVVGWGAVVDPKEHPAFFSWVAKLKECPLMNETLPPHNKLVAKMRERLFQAPKA
ncbi:hypothetical protein MANES_01G186001v8 [Manihot esculenta]|uniref:Uncharacterized protein n=1 Tax=Manihot esculenta TaxID=3983 RepID=A0ACB7IG84_MANES|nr:hypothetical protein MANES_01G186001v8 [Manihot esculenta]